MQRLVTHVRVCVHVCLHVCLHVSPSVCLPVCPSSCVHCCVLVFTVSMTIYFHAPAPLLTDAGRGGAIMIDNNGNVGKWATTKRMAWASCEGTVGCGAPAERGAGVDNDDAYAELEEEVLDE